MSRAWPTRDTYRALTQPTRSPSLHAPPDGPVEQAPVATGDDADRRRLERGDDRVAEPGPARTLRMSSQAMPITARPSPGSGT